MFNQEDNMRDSEHSSDSSDEEIIKNDIGYNTEDAIEDINNEDM